MTTRRFRLLLLSLPPLVYAATTGSAGAGTVSPDTRVVDSVIAGDVASENSHQMKGEHLSLLKTNDLAFRSADTNGWVSWELKVLPGTALDLNVELGGGQRGSPGVSQLLVDGERLATVRVAGATQLEYYRLGAATTAGKSSITVRFQSSSNACGAGVQRVTLTRVPPPTIASTSKATSSRTNYNFIVNAINDQREPANSSDRAKKHFDWWPAKATNQWVQYDFAQPARVSAVEVYWFDDVRPRIGDCAPPKSWRVLYRDHGEWKGVTGATVGGVEEDQYNRMTFDAVESDALRLEVEMPDRHSAGILQWKVE